jgi:hypothetical protein
MRRLRSLLALTILTALAACGRQRTLNRENLSRGMAAYLEQRGDLCLGKNFWPVDVTQREARSGARDAVQMPVLKRLGLVSSTETFAEVEEGEEKVPAKVQRYQLTDAGRRYFLPRGRHGEALNDLCAAKLSLDQVVSWEAADPKHVVVTYTYKVKAAPWTRDPEARRVFPAVARVIQGEGAARMKEGFTLTSRGWIANDLLD